MFSFQISSILSSLLISSRLVSAAKHDKTPTPLLSTSTSTSTSTSQFLGPLPGLEDQKYIPWESKQEYDRHENINKIHK